MEKKMTFNYFYGTEADQFSFYRISGSFPDNNVHLIHDLKWISGSIFLD